MEEKTEHLSLCHFLGKIVLKVVAFFAIMAAVKTILAKVFHKKLEISVSVENDDGKGCCCKAKTDDAPEEASEDGEDAAAEEQTESTEEE